MDVTACIDAFPFRGDSRDGIGEAPVRGMREFSGLSVRNDLVGPWRHFGGCATRRNLTVPARVLADEDFLFGVGWVTVRAVIGDGYLV